MTKQRKLIQHSGTSISNNNAYAVTFVKRVKNHCASPVCSVALQGTVSRVSVQEGQAKSPLEKHHADAVVNFLLRIACQVTVGDRDGTLWSKL